MRQYVNSPLIEAVCEFRFSEEVQWETTTIESIYNIIKNNFPIRSQRKETKCEGIDEESGEVRARRVELEIFSSENNKIEIIIGNQSAVARVIKPYPTWEKFRETIDLVIANFINSLSDEKKIWARLYYKNIIYSDSETVAIDLFNLKPDMGSHLPSRISDFIVGCEFPFNEKNATCRVMITKVFSDRADPTTSYSLNINCRSMGTVDKVSIRSWVDDAHQIVEELFEGCIPNQMRSKFLGE